MFQGLIDGKPRKTQVVPKEVRGRGVGGGGARSTTRSWKCRTEER